MYSDNKRIIITTNKIAISLDLNIMEKYIKKLSDINSNDIMSLRLSQLKSYLKILDISYFVDDTNLPTTPNIIE